MATEDKAAAKGKQAKGKVKAVAGKVTGNRKLRAKGKADQAKGTVKQAGERVKDSSKAK